MEEPFKPKSEQPESNFEIFNRLYNKNLKYYNPCTTAELYSIHRAKPMYFCDHVFVREYSCTNGEQNIA
jgi:hypothetical protein